MFRNSVFSLGALFVFIISQAQAAEVSLSADPKDIKSKTRVIEVEYSREMRRSAPSHGTEIRSIPGATNTYAAGVDSFSYASTLKMREDRKVGVGPSAGGSLGVVGFNIEFNFEDADGAVAGFGAGPGYNSVQVAWKHAFEGDYLAPYVTAGYSRWYNSIGGSAEYNKSDILDRVLTSKEKSEGRFGTDFVNASIGVQYNQLSGDFAGISFFGELTTMVEIKRSILLPNGAVGALYYF